MTWPSLPEPAETLTTRDLSKMDDRTAWEIQKLRAYHQRDNNRDLKPTDREFPVGEFYVVQDESFTGGLDSFYQ